MEIKENQQFNVRIKRLIYHHDLRNFRLKNNLTQAELAEKCGMTLPRLQRIEQLKTFPREFEAVAIAEEVGIEPEKLFPKWSFTAYKDRVINDCVISINRIALSSPEILKLEEPKNLEVEIDNELLKNNLLEVLSILNPREQKIIKMRFGLEGGRTYTLEEVGKEFGVSSERIKQIEAKALQKLKKNNKTEFLKEFL
jgi:RNA polymerase primary sigma factor